jgi:hypothetical protein
VKVEDVRYDLVLGQMFWTGVAAINIDGLS